MHPLRRLPLDSVPVWTVLALGLLSLGMMPLPAGIVWPTLILGSTAACAIPIAGAARRGRIDVLELGVAIAVAYFVLFPLRALVLLLDLDPYANQGALGAPFEIKRLALAIVGLGLVAGGLAYNTPLAARIGGRARLPRVPAFEAAPMWLALVLFLAGTSSTALIALAEQEESSLARLTDGALSSVLSGTSVCMVAGLCLLTRRAVLGPKRDRILLGAALAAVLAVAVGGRFKEPAIVALLSVLVTYRFTRNGTQLGRVVLVGLAVVFVVFPAVQATRLASVRLETNDPVTLLKGLPGQLTNYSIQGGGPRALKPWTPLTEPVASVSSRLYSFDSMTLAVWYTPEEMPYQNGRTLALLAGGLIPRVIWPEKPAVGLGMWFAEHYWGTPLGVREVPQAIGHPAELWIDFGFLGVIVGLTVLGFGYRMAFAAARPSGSATGVLIYAVVLATVVSVDRDLPLVYVSLGQRLAVLGVIMLVLLLLARTRGGSVSDAGPMGL
jgi:hypothetical protein